MSSQAVSSSDTPVLSRHPARARLGLWHEIGRQLAYPSGPFGHLAGLLMERANREPYRLALEALAPGRDDEVLEIGIGPGAGLAELTRQVTRGRVFGLDGSPQMLRRAARRNRCAVASGHLILASGDFCHLPWGAARFDTVLAVNVAYFFDVEGRAAREIRRVLRPGGRAALYVTDRETMRTWPFAGPDTHTTYDAEGLRGLLVRGGFAPEAVEIRQVALPMNVKGLVAIARRGV